jgi:hypothetical protein
MDGDGYLDIAVKNEIVVSEALNTYVVIYNRNGNIFSGWPKQFTGNASVGLIAGDFNGDGRPELIFPTGNWWNIWQALKTDGTSIPNWPITLSSSYGAGLDALPVLGDINNDGNQELLFSTWRSATETTNIWAFSANGTQISGYPKSVFPRAEVRTAPALGDLDGNGKVDIVVKAEDGMLYAWESPQFSVVTSHEWPMLGHDQQHSSSSIKVTISTQNLPAATRGTLYSQALTAVDGLPPYQWNTVSGALPNGLSLDPATGIISGSPNQLGTFSFAIAVKDSNAFTSTKNLSLTVNEAPPTTDFTGTPLTGQAPLIVTFTDTSSGTPSSWNWSFGDGGSSNLQQPSRMFMAPGSYTIALTATNIAGSTTSTKPGYITVLACSNAQTRLAGTSAMYTGLQSAYTMATENDTIQLHALDLAGEAIFNRDIPISVKGGYDCIYSDNPATTPLLGSLRVQDGTVKMDKIRFR